MRPTRTVTLLAILTVALARATGAQSAPAPRAELAARLDSLAGTWVATTPVAGATVAVVKGRDTLLLKAYGERDRERHLPATINTVYHIGSLTKQFTAAAIMQLVEQGKIALTDPVTKYLPQYPHWHGVTIRQLLDHTSGIHSVTSTPEWTSMAGVEATPAQMVALVEKDTLDFAPGTGWRYNNTGYTLLGMVLEKVTGRRYADYVRSRFFTPLGLRSAAYCPDAPTDSSYAVGYALRYGTLEAGHRSSMSRPWAAGALCMNVRDYLRWQAALSGGRVVRPATFARMSTSDTLANGTPANYGFAVWTVTTGGHRGLYHSGSMSQEGFNVTQSWYPDDSLRVVVFSNTSDAGISALHNNLIAAVFGMPLTARGKLVAQPLAAGDRGRYVGTYDLRPLVGRPMTLRLFEAGDTLMAQSEMPGRPAQPGIPLIHLGDDTFGAAFDPTLRLTFFVENGVATRARLVMRNTYEGPRRP